MRWWPLCEAFQKIWGSGQRKPPATSSDWSQTENSRSRARLDVLSTFCNTAHARVPGRNVCEYVWLWRVLSPRILGAVRKSMPQIRKALGATRVNPKLQFAVFASASFELRKLRVD